jgi:hypothetical protein
VHFSWTDGYSSGFEFTTCSFTLGLGALDPTLSGTGILTRTAGGCGRAGAGALARIDVEAFAGLFSGGSAHRSNRKHCGCGCGKGDTGGFLGCNHGMVPQVLWILLYGVFNRYASLEDTAMLKVHHIPEISENLQKC